MKKIIAALFFTSFLCLFNTELKAQSNTDVIIVRVFEEQLKSSQIVISYGDGKASEILELENTSRKNRGLNADKVNFELRKILDRGYELVGTAASGENDLMTTFILQRRKK